MTITSALELIDQYGLFVLFFISLLEAMNCPGMPAGVILPAAGLFAGESGHHLLIVYLAMLIGANLGCLILYLFGMLGDKVAERWIKRHSGKYLEKIERYLERIRNGNWWTMFVCRLIPVMRTLGSLLAGISRMPLRNYMLGTVCGVAVYNAVGIGLGYFASWLFV
ncbi:MAG: DedA family protein [Eubacteriales bacterium]|nr:DedA family protein [Eubacteriales bacterium]